MPQKECMRTWRNEWSLYSATLGGSSQSRSGWLHVGYIFCRTEVGMDAIVGVGSFSSLGISPGPELGWIGGVRLSIRGVSSRGVS